MVEYFAVFTCVWIVSHAIIFKVNQCNSQKPKNVKLLVVENSNIKHKTFCEKVLKYYFKPLLQEQLRNDKKYCFNISTTLFISDGIIEIENGDYNLETSVTTADQVQNGPWNDKERKFWTVLSKTLEGYARLKNEQKIDTLIVIVSNFPQALINKLYLLQNKWHMNIVFVLHYSRLSSQLGIFHRNFRNRIYERLSHKLVSGYFYNSIHKTLLDFIQNPQYDRFEFIRNIPNSKDTICLTNKTIAIVYKPYAKYFCYEDWFVQLMVQLETVLIVNNKENNVKFHFFINGLVSFGLPGLKYKHRFSRITQAEDLYTSDADRKKIVLTAYIDKNELLFKGINEEFARSLPLVGVIVRDKDVEKEHLRYRTKSTFYTRPYRKENIVNVAMKDINSQAAIDLLLDTIIKEGC